MIGVALIQLAGLLSATAASTAHASAQMPNEPLEKGGTYEFTLDVSFGPGVSASEAGIPHPLIQIDVPKVARLDGKELKEFRELARNEFLHAPFERVVDSFPTKIKFHLERAPKDKDAFEISVIGYTNGSDGASFVRERIRLPLKPGAMSQSAETGKSGYRGDSHLQIGDKAKNFTLPTADGEKVVLKEFKGSKNVIVTTYRAFW